VKNLKKNAERILKIDKKTTEDKVKKDIPLPSQFAKLFKKGQKKIMMEIYI